MLIDEPSYSSALPVAHYANFKVICLFIYLFIAVGPDCYKGDFTLSGRIHERTKLPQEIIDEALASFGALTTWIKFIKLLKVTRK